MMKDEKKIREMMPRGYGMILKKRTGKTLAHIYDVVNNEKTNAGIWHEVLKLAEETQESRQEEKMKLYKLKAA